VKIQLVLILTLIFTAFAYAQQPDKKTPDWEKHMKTAESFYTDKIYTEAIKYFTKVLDNNPKEKTALLKRGASYLFLQDNKNAFTDFSALLEIDENNGSAYYLRALSKFNLARDGETVDVEQTRSACDDLFMAKQLDYSTNYEVFRLVCPNL